MQPQPPPDQTDRMRQGEARDMAPVLVVSMIGAVIALALVALFVF